MSLHRFATTNATMTPNKLRGSKTLPVSNGTPSKSATNGATPNGTPAKGTTVPSTPSRATQASGVQANEFQTPTTNSAGAQVGTPSQGTTTIDGLPALPFTPRTRARATVVNSPAATPGLTEIRPFDWDAARGLKPAPYGDPTSRAKKRKSEVGVAGAQKAKRYVKKRGIIERITSMPARISFEISQFPNNLPLPRPKTSAMLLGGIMHVAHLCVRVSQGTHIPDSYTGLEDMYREDSGEPWFNWSSLISLLLIAVSACNALYLFTRIRLYHLHRQPDPVASPHASFVPVELDFNPLQVPPLSTRIWRGVWSTFIGTWRFLLNMSPRGSARGARGVYQVQRLEVWAPGDLELRLFSVYSPVHALLWMATTASNWIMMGVVMGVIGLQLHALTLWFERLVKDKAIIAAEVMHEYDEKFVNPRINPPRREIGVMTHQSEMVNVWAEDDDE